MAMYTVGQLLDIVARATAVIAESEQADEHGELIEELRGVQGVCLRAIGGSHMGAASDVVILEDDDTGGTR